MTRNDALYRLDQNDPDPWEDTTTILFHIPQKRRVRMQLFKDDGELVATLVDEHCAAGDHVITLDAAKLPNGSYFYRLTAGAFESVRRMVITRESSAEKHGEPAAASPESCVTLEGKAS
jgi:hypothetical protein